ncbi:MAG: hypothetical protein JW987_01050 [Anaerolineaceae bacterium]|nr:hypothetical protein [Anaerolineaceae bacterium]
MIKRLWDWMGGRQGSSGKARRWLAEEAESTALWGTRVNALGRERSEYDREMVLEQALEAWRVNPLARRIVELTTQYVVGGGLRLECSDARGEVFLGEWWNHPLNRLEQRVYEWCDELTRAGELFLLVSTDRGGMSYVRAVPAGEIAAVQTSPNDVQQELAFVQRRGAGEEQVWKAYDALEDAPGEEGSLPPVMLHYAVNRPAGTVRGESDLAPLLRWLGRYSAWLEDRARLNRYRNTFLFTVRARFADEEERLARQQILAATPPTPGSILVTDESEEWGVLSPKLESHEAGEDGLALKKMIAAGAGVPLHFLAEPEGATRTTAEAAGGPTYRRFEQKQRFFCWMIADLAETVLARRGRLIGEPPGLMRVEVRGADLSARDNATLAQAAESMVHALEPLLERGLIEPQEALRLFYRFTGEVK